MLGSVLKSTNTRGLGEWPEGLNDRLLYKRLRPSVDVNFSDATLEVDAGLALVLVCPGGVTPAGQRHRDQRADIDRQTPPGPGPAIPKRPFGGAGRRGIQRRPGDIAQRPVDH